MGQAEARWPSVGSFEDERRERRGEKEGNHNQPPLAPLQSVLNSRSMALRRCCRTGEREGKGVAGLEEENSAAVSEGRGCDDNGGARRASSFACPPRSCSL